MAGFLAEPETNRRSNHRGTNNSNQGSAGYSPIHLTNGPFNWILEFKETADVARNRGEPAGRYKKNGAIVQLDRDGTALRRYPFFRAWPTKFNAGDWDASAEEANMQTIVLTYNYFDQVNTSVAVNI
jgi:phage tail-like protein